MSERELFGHLAWIGSGIAATGLLVPDSSVFGVGVYLFIYGAGNLILKTIRAMRRKGGAA